MNVQFIPEVSLGNAMVLLGVICVFLIAYVFFSGKIRTIETNVERVEDIIQHRDFKAAVIEALEEVRHIQHVTQVDTIGHANEVKQVETIKEAKTIEKIVQAVPPKGT